MSWLDPTHLYPAMTAALVSGGLGALAPALVARLPEPAPVEAADAPAEQAVVEADGDEQRLFATTLPPPPPKEPYAEIAAPRSFAVTIVAWSVLVGGGFGLVHGWTGALLYLVPLVPVGVVLLVIDWRTTLLPTRILHPTYAGLAVLLPAATLVDRDLDSLYRAGWGWLVIGGWFWVFWWLFNAWGFGDVRLSRVLGPALGYLGWYEMLTGLALMVFVGGIGGAVLSLVHRSVRRRFPYGPFMLVGATLAVLCGPWIARGLGY